MSDTPLRPDPTVNKVDTPKYQVLPLIQRKTRKENFTQLHLTYEELWALEEGWRRLRDLGAPAFPSNFDWSRFELEKKLNEASRVRVAKRSKYSPLAR